MSLPLPGTPVRGSKTGKPIMALLDLMGRTWALGIVWQLNSGPLSFSQLQHRCENISPSLLTKRLQELQQTRLIERCLDGYQLSEIGQQLYCVIEPLGAFAKDWQNQLKESSDE